MTTSKTKFCYLDNNATTELSPGVTGALMEVVLSNIYGNPSSQHIKGVGLRKVVEASRRSVSSSLGCLPSEVVFTSGGTEANNLVIRSVCNSPGAVIAVSSGEHASVYDTAKAMLGAEVRVIPLLVDGSLDMEQATAQLDSDVSFVSVMLVNNETGVVNPIRKLVDVAHDKGILVHCDAVQAYGKMSINVKELGVDFLTISGHKAHALPGVGALFARKGIHLFPSITGGDQESGIRGGTENYYGILSLGTVAVEIEEEGFLHGGLCEAFEAGILRRISDISINGSDTVRAPGTSSVTFKGIHSAAMLEALEGHGIFASSGPACSSGSAQPSRVLTAMGLSEEDALSTVRFSFSRVTPIGGVAQAIEACVLCAEALRHGGEAT